MVEVQKKTIIAICLVAVGGGLLLYFVISSLNNFNDRFMSSYQKPSLTDIKQMCYNKMVEMGYSQPTWTRFYDTTPPNPTTKVFFQSPKEDLTDQVFESVLVGLDDWKMTLDAWIEGTITNLRQDNNNTNFKLIESKPTTLSGIPAHQIIFSTSDRKVLIVATIKSNVAFWVMYIAEPSKYLKFLSSAEQMISSFKFLD